MNAKMKNDPSSSGAAREQALDRVLFAGYYGVANTGDDVFCSVAAWGAHHKWQARRIGFLCREIPVLPVEADPVFRMRQPVSRTVGI